MKTKSPGSAKATVFCHEVARKSTRCKAADALSISSDDGAIRSFFGAPKGTLKTPR